MNRTRIIIIAIAAFVGLWMFSQSGKANAANCDGVNSGQVSSDTTLLVDS